ncbi:MAG TPA: type II toxin-antitoxin system RelE/ParE family toxin [Xanthobacteraceae bacterium]|jgi:plasmid stabilization system protein ParE
MKLRYRQLALIDLTEIYLYLDKRSPSGANSVLSAIYAAIEDIANNPLSARKTSDAAVRMKIVRRYHYKIFYNIGNDEVEILHVRHGARRPWGLE